MINDLSSTGRQSDCNTFVTSFMVDLKSDFGYWLHLLGLFTLFRRFMPFKTIFNRINQNAIDNAAIFNKLFSLLFISKLIETLSEVSFDLKWDENKHFYTQKRIQMYNKECNTGYKYFLTSSAESWKLFWTQFDKQGPIGRLKMALKMSDICQNDR